MSKENKLSKTITEHYDTQSRSEGSWANAWTPVWDKVPSVPVAAQSPQAEETASKDLREQASVPENASESREVEPIYV